MVIIAHIRQSFAAAFYPRLSEWACAVALGLIGWVLSVNTTLMSNSTTKAYDLILMVGTQQSWARALIIFGTLRLIVLVINGAWRRSPHLRSIMAFLSCGPLCLIALSFTPVFGISFAYAWVFLVMDMFNTIRAAGDARTVDHAHAMRELNGGPNAK